MTKVRISARVLSYLSGSGLFQWRPGDDVPHGDGPAGDRLVAKVRAARCRSDESVRVDLDEAEMSVLWDSADYMACAASDDAGFDNPDALADLNAARALVRQIDKARA